MDLITGEDTFEMEEHPATTTANATSKKRQSAPKNTAVYVSELPEDVTVDELVQYFSKCGIIMDEIMTGKPRVKLYCDEEDKLKGDALIVYLREESVTLALSILDESELRPGHKIRVQEASFNANETSTLASSNESKKNKIDKETWKKHMRKMQKKLEWFDEEAEAQAREAARQERFSKVLILRNMYRPEELEESLDFALQLTEEIAEECEEKLVITDCSVQVIEERADEGMCSVKFKKAIEAQAAAKLMNGRLFAGLRVSATIYDGSFPLPKKRTDLVGAHADEQARLEAFSKYIEENASDNSDSEQSESESSDNEL